jgi:DNA topoisomerase VI subunit B
MTGAPRTAFSFSRELEFATEPELAKRLGCTRALWLRAALKELVDNAIDAAEEAGIDPAIAVTLERDTLTVADNGPGMPPELVERLCVRSERTSSREAYAAPDRGALGNALQVLMALPFGSGHDQAVTVITSRGVEHTITLRVNRLEGRIDVERVERPVPDAPGTTITIARPPQHSLINASRDEAIVLLSDHAWLNPHVEITLNDDGGRWERTTSIRKWTPGLPVPPHWYSLERFCHRVLLEIRRDPKVTVNQFLAGFKGLASTVKRAEVAANAQLSYGHLAALLDESGTSVDPWQASLLLDAMQQASRAPKHAALGGIGRETFADWVAAVNRAVNHVHAPPSFLLITSQTVLLEMRSRTGGRSVSPTCRRRPGAGSWWVRTSARRSCPSRRPRKCSPAPASGSTASTSRSPCSSTGSRPPARRSITASTGSASASTSGTK